VVVALAQFLRPDRLVDLLLVTLPGLDQHPGRSSRVKNSRSLASAAAVLTAA
jgi:hypothetical protein